MLVVAFVGGGLALAGDFVHITAAQLFLAGLTMSLPGFVLTAPILWWALRGRVGIWVALLVIWLAVAPWTTLLLIDAISPGILGQRHAYSELGYALRIWLPGTVAQPVVAALLGGLVRGAASLLRNRL
ncbi:MAG: hypothetical protein U5K81_13210 [Trueperaceae bacterium]|nr:hypothetical protein [Trueperaceae bacterium]